MWLRRTGSAQGHRRVQRLLLSVCVCLCVGGAKSAARRHGEVFLRARRRGQEGVGGARPAARRHGKVLLRARRSGQEGARGEVFFGASRRVRGREARRGLQPGDVRSSLRQRGEVCSLATCEVPFGARRRARAHDLQPGEVFRVSAWTKARRPAGPQPGSSSGSCHSWCRCWWRGPSISLPFSLHRT